MTGLTIQTVAAVPQHRVMPLESKKPQVVAATFTPSSSAFKIRAVPSGTVRAQEKLGYPNQRSIANANRISKLSQNIMTGLTQSPYVGADKSPTT